MSRRKSRAAEREAARIAREEAVKSRSAVRTGMTLLGVGLIAGAAIVLATKKVFDEIFVEDDWSDVDWGEEEDEDYGID